MVTEGPTAGVDGILEVTALGGTWSQATFPPHLQSEVLLLRSTRPLSLGLCSVSIPAKHSRCAMLPWEEEAQELGIYCSERNVLQRQGRH